MARDERGGEGYSGCDSSGNTRYRRISVWLHFRAFSLGWLLVCLFQWLLMFVEHACNAILDSNDNNKATSTTTTSFCCVTTRVHGVYINICINSNELVPFWMFQRIYKHKLSSPVAAECHRMYERARTCVRFPFLHWVSCCARVHVCTLKTNLPIRAPAAIKRQYTNKCATMYSSSSCTM